MNQLTGALNLEKNFNSITHNLPMEPETVCFKSVTNLDIHADVYRTKTTRCNAPAIVYIHGGCLMYGSRKMIKLEQVERYLKWGYTLISLDYRLAPETKLPFIIEDLQDAFRWIQQHGTGLFNVDPERLAVVGHSAGGYLALMSGFCVKPVPKAIVSFYGYGDIIGDWYSKPDPFYCSLPAVSEAASGIHKTGSEITEPYAGRGKDQLYLYYRQHGLWAREVGGHDPHSEASFFKPYCPVQNVTRSFPPTLLLHGDHDTDVPYQQSVQMAEALSRAGVENQLITIENGPHGFDGHFDDLQVQSAFAAIESFLRRHLGE
ncbi:alpha/beta hydrolase [candidate division KSB1 bacterium]|nr:alpha/beta hydrolase [candidate division KSB1 bacterium]